ncbi:MAG: ABC transporter substrate-binding protein, partial [Phycisphaerae bacterium]
LIDREQIIEYLLKGQAKPTTGPFYIYGPQTDPDIEPWPYNPQEAARLLDEAGWVDSDGDGLRDKDGVPFRFKLMIRSGDPYYERLAKFIKDEALNIGIEVVIDLFEWSIFIERLLDRKFDAQISGWGGVVEEDPYQVWHSSQATDRGSNHVSFSNKEADKIIEQARRTLDSETRNELYRRFHRIVHEEQPYTFLYIRPEMRFLHPRFENVNIYRLDLDWLQWYVPIEKQKYR